MPLTSISPLRRERDARDHLQHASICPRRCARAPPRIRRGGSVRFISTTAFFTLCGTRLKKIPRSRRRLLEYSLYILQTSVNRIAISSCSLIVPLKARRPFRCACGGSSRSRAHRSRTRADRKVQQPLRLLEKPRFIDEAVAVAVADKRDRDSASEAGGQGLSCIVVDLPQACPKARTPP